MSCKRTGDVFPFSQIVTTAAGAFGLGTSRAVRGKVLPADAGRIVGVVTSEIVTGLTLDVEKQRICEDFATGVNIPILFSEPLPDTGAERVPDIAGTCAAATFTLTLLLQRVLP